MAELWGWCATCQRSFYLGSPGGDAEAPPEPPRCPVCLEPANEVRSVEEPAPEREAEQP